MASKKPTLPEIVVNSGQIVDDAKRAIEARSKVGEFQTEEDQAKDCIVEQAQTLRRQEADKGKFIGLVRVTDEELPPVRTEFRLKAKPMDISQKQDIQETYGPAYPVLWEEAKVGVGISDTEKAWNDVKAKGLDPTNYFTLSIKKGMEDAVAELSDAITSGDAIIPVKGFLAELDKLTLDKEAVAFTRKFLEDNLVPSVVLGSKGKKGA